MRIRKDEKIDVAYIQLRKGKIIETVSVKPGLLFDIDKHGEILGIEILSLQKIAPKLHIPPAISKEKKLAR